MSIYKYLSETIIFIFFLMLFFVVLYFMPWYKRLSDFGYRVGIRVVELLNWREKNGKREIKILQNLYFIHTNVWKMLFGKQADSLEKHTEKEDECKFKFCWTKPK